MTRRQSEIFQQRCHLNQQGWNIQDQSNAIRPNSGSETLYHLVSKATAAKVCIDVGYRVASECVTVNGDECDILAYGLEDRRPIVIELENSLTEDVADRKREQYTIGDIRETYVISLDEAPDDPDELYEYIGEQTGLL